jgi:hypothetical protein
VSDEKKREKIPIKVPRPKERAPHRPTRVHDEGRTKKPEPPEEDTIEEGLRELDEEAED